MGFEFKLPDIGEGVVEGEIVKWLVAAGDSVDVDQPVVEVMTDKATVVIPSPRKGTIRETRGAEGDVVEVGAVLVVIDEDGVASGAVGRPSAPDPSAGASASGTPAPGAPSAGASASGTPAPGAPSAGASASGTPSAAASASGTPASGASASGPPSAGASTYGAAASAGRASAPGPSVSAPPSPGAISSADGASALGGGAVLAAPATRRLARELGIDLSTVTGTGPAGRVTSEDVRAAAEALATDGGAPEPAVPPSRDAPSAAAPIAPPAREAGIEGEDRIVPVRGVRGKIWDSMTRAAFTAPHFTFVEACDVTELVAWRSRLNQLLDEGEPRLTFLPFVIKAVCVSLTDFPQLNGQVNDAERSFVQRAAKHIGVAVASDRGLTVPVVRDAHRRSLLELSSEVRRLGDAVRQGTIAADDLGGSTFTITSLGKDGGLLATPIINHPEVAILGVHRLQKQPVVHDEDRIVVRQVMNLSLSCDHRLIDGHVAARFTYRVIELLQSPDRLVLEMG